MFDKNLRIPEVPDDVREHIESMLESLSAPPKLGLSASPKLNEDQLSEIHQTLPAEALRRDEELMRMFTEER